MADWKKMAEELAEALAAQLSIPTLSTSCDADCPECARDREGQATLSRFHAMQEAQP